MAGKWRGIAYHPSPTFEAELARASETVTVLAERAERAVQTARAAVPRGRGRYQRTLFAEIDEGEVAMVSTSSLWHLIEYGSVHNPPYAPLRRGVEAAGCRFVDDAR